MPDRFRDRHRSLRAPGGRLRWTLIGALAALLVAAPFAGAVSHSLGFGGRNPGKGRGKVTTSLYVTNSHYGLTLDNSNRGGGGAKFTCVAGSGGSVDNHEPCVRAENKGAGFAFEMNFAGNLGGVFQIGNNIDKPFPDARPFVTNATGVATGLNADRVDGLHAQEIITAAVEQSAVQIGPQGPAGPSGPAGPRGQQGQQGVQGPPGTPLIASETTAASTDVNPAITGKPVVSLTGVALTSSEPTSGGSGTDLVTPVELDPGTYVISATMRAFDLTQANTTPVKQYGVATLFVDTAAKGTIWTPDVPADGTNPATGSLTTTITVPAGGATLALQGVVRSASGVSAVAQGGADLVVTQVNPIH